MAKSVKVFARVNVGEQRELVRIAKKLDIPASQIVRDALREKISELKQKMEAEQQTAGVAA